MKLIHVLYYILITTTLNLVENAHIYFFASSFRSFYSDERLSQFSYALNESMNVVIGLDIANYFFATFFTIFFTLSLFLSVKKTGMMSGLIGLLVNLVILISAMNFLSKTHNLYTKLSNVDFEYRKHITSKLSVKDYYVYKYFYNESKTMNQYEFLNFLKYSGMKIRIEDYINLEHKINRKQKSSCNVNKTLCLINKME